MKTAEETLDCYFRKNAAAFFDDKEVLKLLTQAMEEYAESYHRTKVKNLAQPDVIKSVSDLDGKTITVKFKVSKLKPKIYLDD